MNYTVDYLEGFCKAAEESGVRPSKLLKEAGIVDTLFGSGSFPFDPGVIQNLMANEHVRRALIGALVSGTTAAITSPENKLRNSLIAAGLGGAATYGASATGFADNMPRHFNNLVREMKARNLTWQMHGSPKQSVTPQSMYTFLNDLRRRHAPEAGQSQAVNQVRGDNAVNA